MSARSSAFAVVVSLLALVPACGGGDVVDDASGTAGAAAPADLGAGAAGATETGAAGTTEGAGAATDSGAAAAAEEAGEVTDAGSTTAVAGETGETAAKAAEDARRAAEAAAARAAEEAAAKAAEIAARAEDAGAGAETTGATAADEASERATDAAGKVAEETTAPAGAREAAGDAGIVAGAAKETSEAATASDTTTEASAAAEGAAAAVTAGDDRVIVTLEHGKVVIDLFEEDAPKHAENFKKLVREGFYDGLTFHRVIDGFMAQGGDPKGDGTGGPGYRVPAEIKRKHVRGSVAAARLADGVNPNRESSGSQFYICFKPAPFLDGAYTVFGQVVEGMEAVDKLTRVKPGTLPTVEPDKILKMELAPVAAE